MITRRDRATTERGVLFHGRSLATRNPVYLE